MTSDALRYARQVRLPEVGEAGQRRLSEASVLVVGAGGLGAPALRLLAGAGVGHIRCLDFDDVNLSNIHRQTLFTSADVGKAKADAARERLHLVNASINIDVRAERLTAQNAQSQFDGMDLVLDGSDTFATRYLVNDASVLTGTPNVFASVSQFSGQASVFGTAAGPCYRCLFPEPPPAGLIPNCEDGGVLGVVPSLFGTIQAAEALKLILRVGTPLVGRLLMVDVLDVTFKEIVVERDPSCPACGVGARPITHSADPPELTVRQLRDQLAGDLPPRLIDVRTREEHGRDNIGGTLIPLDTLADSLSDLNPSETYVTYCASGQRSMTAARALHAAGFDVRTLRGGIEAWRSTP